MSFSILYSDAFLSEKEVVVYDNISLLDAVKTKNPLNHEDVVISRVEKNGVVEVPANSYKYVEPKNRVIEVPAHLYKHVKPKNGEYIAFVKPKDSDTARIALTVALIAAGQYYAAPYLTGLGVNASIAAGLVTVGSTYLASALIPYDTPDSNTITSDAAESATSSISGNGNSINQGGVVPYVIGTHKYTPPKAMQPVTEYVNKTEAYLTEVFCLGSGPLIIDYDSIKIDETSILDYDNVELQVKDNYKNGSPISLVSGIIDSEVVSATFSGSGDSATRTTSTNCERIDVEIGYSGLTDYNDEGNKIATSCSYVIEYKSVGSDEWLGFNGTTSLNVCTAVNNQVLVRVKNGTNSNDAQRYNNRYSNQSYFNFPDGVPSYISAGKYFNIKDSGYNSGSFYAYSISGNRVYVGGYTVTDITSDTQRLSTFGKTLTDESNCNSYGNTGSAAISVDTDATSVATYRSYSLTNIEKDQYDVRITRITAEPSSDSNIQNEFQWTQLKSTQLTDDDGSAIVPFKDDYCYIGVRIKATDQLNGAIGNLSVVATSVCYEYDESDQSLTGDIASGNPAWEYLKIITGDDAKQKVDLDEVDIDAFIEWAELCDEQVLGSDGSYDPRFRINTVIDTEVTAEDTLKKIASIGRASRRWVDFKESVIIDKADIQPSIFLNPANIVSFQWEKSFARRADAYNLSFYNEENDYESDELVVQIDDSVAYNDLEYIEDLDATGITDPNQVYRYGKFAHAQLQLRPETYTATLGINNLVFLRGDVVGLTHDRVQGITCFGQVLSVDGLVVSVDNPFNISNEDLPLYATFSNPESYGQTVATYEITGVTDNQITFASLPTFDLVDSYYSIGNAVESLTRLYMVKAITSADDLTATVQLVDYASPEIYDAEDTIANYISGTVDLTISRVAAPVAPVITSIVTDESALKVNADGSLQVRALIELEANYIDTYRPQPTSVHVYYRPNGTNGQYSKQIFSLGEQLYVTDLTESLYYDFKVRYVSQYGAASEFDESLNVEIIGKTTPPTSVVAIDYDSGFISWLYPNPALDFAGFKVRYATGSTATWETAISLHDGLITDTKYDVSSFISDIKSFYVKAVDTSGNYSETAAKVVVNLGDVDYSNIVTTINKYDDGWPDTVSNGVISGIDGFLYNSTYEFYGDDDSAFYNTSDTVMFYNTRKKEMHYTFDFVPEQADTGARLSIGIKSSIDTAYLQWVKPSEDAFYSALDSTVFYGNDSDAFYANTTDAFYDVNTLNFYTTDDSVVFYGGDTEFFYEQDGESNFTAFSGVVPSMKRVKYRFRVVVPENTDEISNLEYVKIVVDVEDIEEEINNYQLLNGEGRLPLNEFFRSIENMQLTLQDDSGTASYAKIIDKDELLGPLIETYDSTGTKVTSVIDALIRGY